MSPSSPNPSGGLCRALPLVLALATTAACGSARVRDPHEAAEAFARAAARADVDALYGMLSPAAQRALAREDVRRLVQTEAIELREQAQALSAGGSRAVVTARLRFADGEEVALAWSGERFAVESGGTLPGGAPTPEAALDELRRAIARRSYPALLRLLSPATRSAIEQDLRTLVIGLERPETLLIQTTGDASSASVPGGHHVTMKRQGGIWRVEDFD